MKVKIESIKSFAAVVYDLGKSDRDVTIACAGMTGEGKSVFTSKLQMAYSVIAKRPWTFANNLTWSRDELMKWIDGDKQGHGRKEEYTAILPDELISMFFNRNWWEDKQKGAVELFNKCRDRHLFIAGNIPNFWHLDSGMMSRIRFYGYIPRGRGKAWIFEQEDNPFSKDPWNTSENLKMFRKKKNPYKCPNFVCEIPFDDFTPEEKHEYYAIRNTKRKNTEQQNKKDRDESYGKIKRQRDSLIRYLFVANKKQRVKDVADIMDNELSPDMISLIKNNKK